MSIFAFLISGWWAFLLAILVGIFVGAVIAMATEQKLGGVLSGVLTAVLVFGLVAGISSYTQVEKGTVGLVSRFGQLSPVPLEPGLHWVVPFVDKVEEINTKQQSYEMSSYPDTSTADWKDFTVDSKTSNGQTIQVSTTTIFEIPASAAVVVREQIGTVDRVVENVVKANARGIVRTEAKNWSAEDLYTGNLVGFQSAVRDQLVAKFADTGHGVVLVDFIVRNVSFTEEYENSIEAKQIAAENIVTRQNEALAAKYEADKIAALAKGEADASIERARGNAEAVKLASEAEAYAIEQKGTALKRFPQVLQLEFVQTLGSKTVFLPSEGIQWLLPAPVTP